MRLAEQVVSSGEVINIAEIVEVEPSGCGDNLRSLLAMPIRNRNSEIIGKNFYIFVPSLSCPFKRKKISLHNECDLGIYWPDEILLMTRASWFVVV